MNRFKWGSLLFVPTSIDNPNYFFFKLFKIVNYIYFYILKLK